MDIFISHTVGCSGWDMPEIYKGTNFKIASRTSDYIKYLSKDIQMLDWDFRRWEKKPQEIEDLHLQIVKDYDIEVVMSMDIWDYNIKKSLEYADKLQKHTDKVLIPVHYYCKELLDYDLAYPNANWFAKNVFPSHEYRDNIKHILGGSPQKQIEHLTTNQLDIEGYSKKFSKVESIDGNQLFVCATRHGKEWYVTKPHWRNNGNDISNEQKFKNSVKRLDSKIKRISNGHL